MVVLLPYHRSGEVGMVRQSSRVKPVVIPTTYLQLILLWISTSVSPAFSTCSGSVIPACCVTKLNHQRCVACLIQPRSIQLNNQLFLFSPLQTVNNRIGNIFEKPVLIPTLTPCSFKAFSVLPTFGSASITGPEVKLSICCTKSVWMVLINCVVMVSAAIPWFAGAVDREIFHNPSGFICTKSVHNCLLKPPEGLCYLHDYP
ncbi:hypothetical protein CS542_01640 [Pedobacter sp. IW39]|nr:hypothetical protein CS542_01640 [Pedobacter sp. IW39]